MARSVFFEYLADKYKAFLRLSRETVCLLFKLDIIWLYGNALGEKGTVNDQNMYLRARAYNGNMLRNLAARETLKMENELRPPRSSMTRVRILAILYDRPATSNIVCLSSVYVYRED